MSDHLNSSDDRNALRTHVLDGRMVLPPQWNMTPSEYRTLVLERNRATGEDAGFAIVSVIAPLALSVLCAWAFANPQAVVDWFTGSVSTVASDDGTIAVTVPDGMSDALAYLSSVLVVYGVACSLRNCWRNLPDIFEWMSHLGDHPSTLLDTLDPAEALSIEALPDEIAALVYYLADDHGIRPVPSERAERLLVAYECTMAFCEVLVGHSKPTIATLVRECPEALERLLAYCETPVGGSRGFSDSHRVNTVKAIKSALTIGRLSGVEEVAGYAPAAPAASGHSTVRAATSARDDAPAGASANPSLTQRWAEAVSRHDAITEEWADIITDPLAALDHSLLLDVTQPRTAKFIEVYGQAQDLRALRGIAYPTNSDVVGEYLSIVRKVDEAWSDAVRHARHVHLAWLPETEAKWVRQASALLATAADESQPMHLRADAAAKAGELLAKVTSFYLPPATATAIETQARLALPAGSSAAPAAVQRGGAILSPTVAPAPAPKPSPQPSSQPSPSKQRTFVPMDGTVY